MVSQSMWRGYEPLQNAVEDVVYAYTPPDTSHIMPSTERDMETISKMGPMIVMGLLKLRVLR
jgi:hypothetical protein